MREQESSETRDVLRWNSTYVWIISGLFALLLVVIGSIVNWYVDSVSAKHDGFQKQLNTIYETLAQRGERITKLEMRVEECEKHKP